MNQICLTHFSVHVYIFCPNSFLIVFLNQFLKIEIKKKIAGYFEEWAGMKTEIGYKWPKFFWSLLTGTITFVPYAVYCCN